MMTVHEVSELAHVSVRTLHHYDHVGLLRPSQVSEAGYRRLYDEEALARLQLILLFRELRFPLKEIRRILDSPDFDRNRALEQQIELLTLQQEHTANLITLARGILMRGVKNINFSAFDTRRIDEYSAQARALYGKTDAYRECEEKERDRSEEERKALEEGLMDFFRRLGALREGDPASPEAQAVVDQMREYITLHFYRCTPQILSYLASCFCGGGSMTENIDALGGAGTARFAGAAIEAALHRLPEE